MSKLPVVSGRKLVGLLVGLGYTVVRRRGSHIRLRKAVGSGEHNITIPDHREVAKGTLNDILGTVSQMNGIPKDELVDRLR